VISRGDYVQQQPLCTATATIDLDACRQAWQAGADAPVCSVMAATVVAHVDVRRRRVTLETREGSADAVTRAMVVARLQDALPADVRVGFAQSHSRTDEDGTLALDVAQICAAAWLAVRQEPALGAVISGAEVQVGESTIELTLRTDPGFALAKRLDARIALACEDLCGCHVRVTISREAHKAAVLQFRDQVSRELADDAAEWSQAQAMPAGKRAQAGGTDAHIPGRARSSARAGERGRRASVEMAIGEIQDECKSATVRGCVFAFESRELSSGRRLLRFGVTDRRDSLLCKAFVSDDERDRRLLAIADGVHLSLTGSVAHDTYEKDLVMTVRDAVVVEPDPVTDGAVRKRVELHAHTQMSAQDGIIAPADLVKRAADYGHTAIAITDHAVVQAFPQAYAAGRKHGVKILYGVEFNVYDDVSPIVRHPSARILDEATEYVIFDTETTGLSAAEHELIELAGVKMRGGEVVDTFASLISPTAPIPLKITEITNITNDMVRGQPALADVLPKFLEFCGDAVLVAHNADFDCGFLDAACRKCGLPAVTAPVIDTLALARALLPSDRNHRLKTLAQKFDVALVNHHRALADAEATGRVLFKLLQMVRDQGCSTLRDLAGWADHKAPLAAAGRGKPFHATALVMNRTGLKNLYRLISLSHTDYFAKGAGLPRDVLSQYRDGLLIGSACVRGELLQMLLRGRRAEDIAKRMKFYDFVELQPPDHAAPLVASGEMSDPDRMKVYHKQLLDLADQLHIPVCATGDVHILDEEDRVFREVILVGAQRGSRPELPEPVLTYRTTEQMLAAFAHLGERAVDVVIDAPVAIADRIEDVQPLPDRLYPPLMEGADDEVREVSQRKAHELYGPQLPPIVQTRLEKELHSIISHGFSVNYLIAHKLVTRSLEEGYIVGSRGSVGSSLVAHLMDITEVNPLAPHYRCAACAWSEFVTDGTVGSGFDLPDKTCPQCGAPLRKDGHDIPFETFLGFDGDKVPDIDLNFSGEYQARAHRHTEDLFGADHVFRAGTISTVAEKTAFGFVRRFAEERGRTINTAETLRLVAGCTGVKRTTGQHPGGLIIIPADKDIHDFTPIQYPADDAGAAVRTTHFDFRSLHDNLLKLDLLGHDDPTMLRMLHDLTETDPRTVSVDDPRVYALFRSVEPLGVDPAQLRSTVGTYGIPEFGTAFVRQMLEETQPASFADLVRISGLSHGTDVWLNNAQELIRGMHLKLADVICCRDDIMVYLLYRGLEPARAFAITESVRKGKGLKPDDEAYLKSFDVPEWYLESCRRIKYMFPKAHAAAYVLNAVRIAYFKLYEPLAYYAAYFTVRAGDFDLELMARGPEALGARIDEIVRAGNDATPKERGLLPVLEVALEMSLRGLHMKGLDLLQSDATRFTRVGDGLLPPFSAGSGIGEAAARAIVAAREQSPFLSVQDLQERSRASRAVIDLLRRMGCLEALPESNQLSLF